MTPSRDPLSRLPQCHPSTSTNWGGVPPPLLLHTQKRARFASLSSSTCRLMALIPVASFVAGDAAASDVPATRSTFNRCRSPVLLSIQGILGTVAWGCGSVPPRTPGGFIQRPAGLSPRLAMPFRHSRTHFGITSASTSKFCQNRVSKQPPSSHPRSLSSHEMHWYFATLPRGRDHDPDLLRHGTCTSRRAQASRVIPQKRLT